MLEGKEEKKQVSHLSFVRSKELRFGVSLSQAAVCSLRNRRYFVLSRVYWFVP